MLNFSSRHRYFLYRVAIDMRKGIYGLGGLVRRHIRQGELLSGDVFIYLNKRRDRIKILVWDREGWVVYPLKLSISQTPIPSTITTPPSIKVSHRQAQGKW